MASICTRDRCPSHSSGSEEAANLFLRVQAEVAPLKSATTPGGFASNEPLSRLALLPHDGANPVSAVPVKNVEELML